MPPPVGKGAISVAFVRPSVCLSVRPAGVVASRNCARKIIKINKSSIHSTVYATSGVRFWMSLSVGVIFFNHLQQREMQPDQRKFVPSLSPTNEIC